MKQKIAGRIVQDRLLILAVIAVLTVVCAFTIRNTKINYDLNKYLSDETMTKRALRMMVDEFGSSEQLRVMFVDMDDEELERCIDQINSLDEVLVALHSPEDDVTAAEAAGEQGEKGTEKTYRLVTVTMNDGDPSALVLKLRSMFPEAGEYYVGGSAASLLDVQNSVAQEIPFVMLISVAVILGVLLLTSHAWLEPVVILLVLAVSIVINLGTNFIFPEISFITFAVSAILQLALSIDYAIMLLHTWNACCDEGLGAREAMKKALAESFMRIASSALTTVGGLLCLLFMSFTIGFDIGIVLSKGIIISMLCVFLLMPSFTIFMRKALRKTRHRPISLGGEHLARLILKFRRPFAVVLMAMIVCGAVLQSQNTYSFSDSGQMSKSESYAVDRVFGATNPMVVMVPAGDEDEDYDRQRELVRKLTDIRLSDGRAAVADVSAMVTTGAEALKYYTAEDVAQLTGMNLLTVRLFFLAQGFGESVRADRLLAAAGELGAASPMPETENGQGAASGMSVAGLTEMLDAAKTVFKGKNYDRLILNLGYTVPEKISTEGTEAILAACDEVYGTDYYMTGVPMSGYDIGKAFQTDLLKVNIMTFLIILLIVTISFRSLVLPLLLVFVIEGAIWITMGISRLMGQSLFFMCSLICLCMQMGATIDYGILVSDQYRSLRRSGKDICAALTEALKKALPTVLTSGIILTVAGYCVGRGCSVYYISSIGMLLSRGAAISVALVLTLLPSLLVIFDRIVCGKSLMPAEAGQDQDPDGCKLPGEPGTDGAETVLK